MLRLLEVCCCVLLCVVVCCHSSLKTASLPPGMIDELQKVVDQRQEQTLDKIQGAEDGFAKSLGDFDSACQRKFVEGDAKVAELAAGANENRQRIAEIFHNVEMVQQDVSKNYEQLKELQGQTAGRLSQHIDAQDTYLAGLKTVVTENHRRLTDNCTDIERKLTFQSSAQDLRMNDLAQHIQDDKQHFTNICANLDQTTQEQQQHFTNMCAQLDTKLSEKSGAHDARIENQHQYFTDVCANLDQKFAEKNAGQDLRVENQRVQMETLFASSGRKYDDKNAAQDKRADELSSAVDRNAQRFETVCSTMESKLEAKDAAQDSLITALQQNLGTYRTECVAKSRAIENKFDGKVIVLKEQAGTHERHFSSALTKLGTDTELKAAAQTDRLNELGGTVEQQQQDITKNFDYAHDTIAKGLKEQSERTVELGETVRSRFQEAIETSGQTETRLIEKSQLQHATIVEMASSVTKLGQKLEDSTRTLDRQVTERCLAVESQCKLQQTYTTECCSNIEKKLEHSLVAQDERFKAQVAHIAKKCENIQYQVLEKDALQDTKRDKLAEKLQDQREELSRRCDSLDQKYEADLLAQDAQIVRNHEQMIERNGALEKKMNEKNSAQDSKVHGIANTVQEHFTQFNQANLQLDDKFTEKSEALRLRVQSEHEHNSRTCAALDAKLSDTDSRQDARLDELDNMLVSFRDNDFVTKCANLESQFELRNSVQEERSETLEEYINDKTSNLDQKLMDKDRLQDERMDGIDSKMLDQHAQIKQDWEHVNNKLTGAIETQDERAEAHYQHFTECFSNLDTKFLENHRDQDARVTELLSTVNDHREEMLGKVSRIEDVAAEDSEKHTEKAERSYQHFTNACENLEKTIAEKDARQDTRLEESTRVVQQHYHHFAQICEGMDARFTESNNSQDMRLKSHHQHFTDMFTGVQEEMESSITKHGANFTDACKALDSKFNDKTAEQESRMDVLHGTIQENYQHFAVVGTDMERHFNVVCSELENKSTEEMALRDGRMANHHAHFASLCANLDQKFVDKNEAQDALINGHHEHFTGIFSNIDSKSEQQNDELKTALQETNKHFTAVCTSLDTKFSATDFALVAKTLEQKMTDDRQHFTNVCANLDQTTQEQQQHFTNACAQLDHKLLEKSEAQDARIENQHQYFTDVCANLDQKTAEKDAAQDLRMENQRVQMETLFASFGRKYDDKNAAQDKRADELSSAVDRNAQRFETVCSAMESKLTEKDASQDERMDELLGFIQGNHQHFTDVCRMLDKKLAEETSAVTEHADAQLKDLRNVVAKLDQKVCETNTAQDERVATHYHHFTEVCANINQKMNEKFAGTDDRVDALENRIESEHDYFTGVCESLDGRFTELDASRQEQMSQHYNHFTDAFDTLSAATENRFGTQQSQLQAVSEGTDEQFKHFTDVCTKLDKKYGGSTATIRAMQLKLAENMSSQTARCDDLEANVVQNRGDIVKTVENTKQLIHSMDQKQSAAFSEQQLQVSSMCANMEHQLAEKNASQDLRTDQLVNTVDTQREDLSRRCDSLDQTCAEENAAQEEQIVRNHDHMLERTSTLEKKMNEKNSAQDSKALGLANTVQEHFTQFNQTCLQLDDKVTEKSEALRLRVQTEHEFISSTCAALDAKLSDTDSRQDARLDELDMHSMEQREVFNQKCANLESQFSLRNATQDERAENLQQFIVDTCALLLLPSDLLPLAHPPPPTTFLLVLRPITLLLP